MEREEARGESTWNCCERSLLSSYSAPGELSRDSWTGSCSQGTNSRVPPERTMSKRVNRFSHKGCRSSSTDWRPSPQFPVYIIIRSRKRTSWPEMCHLSQRDTVCKLAGAAIRGGWRGGRRLINGTDYNRQARGRGVVLVGLAGRGFGREKKRIAWPFCWGKVPTVSLPVTYPNFSRLFELARPLHSYIC